MDKKKKMTLVVHLLLDNPKNKVHCCRKNIHHSTVRGKKILREGLLTCNITLVGDALAVGCLNL
jgi:hypothetical protein